MFSGRLIRARPWGGRLRSSAALHVAHGAGASQRSYSSVPGRVKETQCLDRFTAKYSSLSRGLDSPIAVPQAGSVSPGFGDLRGIRVRARPCPTIPNKSGSHIIPRDGTVCTKPLSYGVFMLRHLSVDARRRLWSAARARSPQAHRSPSASLQTASLVGPSMWSSWISERPFLKLVASRTT